MKCEQHLIVRIDNEQEAKELIEAMFSDAEIVKGGFVCKVARVSVERVGSKQFGDYRLQAAAHLPVLRRHEDN